MTDEEHRRHVRRQNLERLLLEGIASGPPEEATPDYLADLRREAEEIIRQVPPRRKLLPDGAT